MKIQTVERITTSDLTANAGSLLVVAEALVFQGKPVQPVTGVLAGIWQPYGDGNKQPRYITIAYHFGRKAWHLMIEHTRQMATQMERGTLSEVVGMFERQAGFQLPDIKVMESGVGVYSARSSLVSENPWALEDGKVYRCRDKTKGLRTFEARVQHGLTRIHFIQGMERSEAFDPRVVLSLDDWASLRIAPME